MTAELPNLLVTTKHSQYVIDQNAGRFQRRVIHEHGNQIDGYSRGEWNDYVEVYSGLEPGEPLVITLPGDSWIRSTLVQSVEELSGEVAA